MHDINTTTYHHNDNNNRRTVGVAYPFSALVGQAEMKLALILAAIDPGLGGVLLVGHKGTAKSTAARAVMSIWPDEGRLVTLPLGATEDRVVGAIDLEAALTHGRAVPEPGLLARTDKGLLYLDEVNLLDDHLAALILDAAQTGWVRVEREGLGFGYPSRFVLVGTMNPEEGQVSPQLLDRFGLAVTVIGEAEPELRREIVLRRLAFEADPARFAARWADEDRRVKSRLVKARQALGRVTISESILDAAARLASESLAAGQRAELSLIRAARALAAWQGEAEVGPEHLKAVAEPVLIHRRRQPLISERPNRAIGGRPGRADQIDRDNQPREASGPVQASDRPIGDDDGRAGAGREVIHQARSPFGLKLIDPGRNGGFLRASGRSLKRETVNGSGRYVRAGLERLGREIALDATLRAAAPHQAQRRTPGLALAVHSSDIREKIKVKPTGRLIVFAVDGSGSMGALLRMEEAKAAILSLLSEAYQKRDRVGLISFRGPGAEVLLPPTNSVELAKRSLEELPTGGKTPLAQGLQTAFEVVGRELARDAKLNPLIVLLSDGKPNVTLAPGADPWEEVLGLAERLRRPGLSYLVVDTDWSHWMSRNVNRRLAEGLGGGYVKLDQLRAEGLVGLVRERTATRATR